LINIHRWQILGLVVDFYGKNMPDNLPATTSLILVAVINQPRDLEIARLLGWYRIPLRSAPKVIAIDYLAFYQTAAFEEHKWRIQYVAPYRGHELTTRLELIRDEPDHPHAGQEYFKIQLGSLLELPRPILAEGWRRITFFYTTGELLLKADTIHDLVVPEDERPVLWQALRDRASKSQAYQPAIPSNPDIDLNLNLELLSGWLGIKELEGS
jgi:hypothetical protein